MRRVFDSQLSEARKNSCEINGGDRISDLPDSILHYILSFIDTKYAVQTIVLSKRWRHVWSSLPYLYFENATPGHKSLVDFVNKVLILRDSSSDIKTFKLLSNDIRDTRHVYTWILAAIKRNVQQLLLEVFAEEDPVQLPSCLFTCHSLTSLELSLGSKHPKLVLPDSIDLPNLGTLLLGKVTLVDEKATSKFISSCPSLKTMYITKGRLDLLENFVISAPKLERLGITGKLFNRDRIDLHNCKIKVCAPNLKTFVCGDYMTREFSFVKLSHIDYACIIMEIEGTYNYLPLKDLDIPEYKKKEYVQRMRRLLEAVQNVRSLLLSPGMLTVAFELPAQPEKLSMQFRNLKYLELYTWLSRDCVLAIMHLLEISPNIEIFTLKIIQNGSSQKPLNWDEKMFTTENMGECLEEYWELGLAKQSMLHHLKFVKIRGVIGCVNEFKLLEFLLKNAVALEKLVIWTFKEKSPDREKGLINFSNALLTIPRASSNFSLFFF